MNCELTTVLAALLTPTIAVLGAYIAYRQWRTARNKLKLDLFDRRLAVYDGAVHLIGSIVTSGRMKDEADWKFLTDTKAAKWLFDESVSDYLENKLRLKALDLQVLQAELEGLQGKDRSENIRKQAELKNWLGAQFKVLDEKFAPYIRVQH